MTVKNFILFVPVYLMVLSYPLLVHFGLIVNNIVPMAIMSLLVAFAISIKFWRTAFLLSLMLVAALLMLTNNAIADLYFLPPVAINFFVGTIFLHGLGKNQRPLIEKYIELMEGEVPLAERQYARSVTKVWVVVLFLLMAESIILWLYFPHEVWSLFTNFINYLILASMFVIEYVVRRKVFPDKHHMSFMEFIVRLKRIKLKSVVM